MFSFNDPSPLMPSYQQQDAYAPNLGSAVPGGDPRMNAALSKKPKPQWQSALEGLLSNMQDQKGFSNNGFTSSMGGDMAPVGTATPEHKGKGILGGLGMLGL